MKNIDQTVRKETCYIALSVLILSLFMESIFLIIGRWNYTVLLGNALSAAVAILNFFFDGAYRTGAVTKRRKGSSKQDEIIATLRDNVVCNSCAWMPGSVLSYSRCSDSAFLSPHCNRIQTDIV